MPEAQQPRRFRFRFPSTEEILKHRRDGFNLGRTRLHSRDNELSIYENDDEVELRELSDEEISVLFEGYAQEVGRFDQLRGEPCLLARDETETAVERHARTQAAESDACTDPLLFYPVQLGGRRYWDDNDARMAAIQARVARRDEKTEEKDAELVAEQAEEQREFDEEWLELQRRCIAARETERESRHPDNPRYWAHVFPRRADPAGCAKPLVVIGPGELEFTVRKPLGIFAPPPDLLALDQPEAEAVERTGWKHRSPEDEYGVIRYVVPDLLHLEALPDQLPEGLQITPQRVPEDPRRGRQPGFRTWERGQTALAPTNDESLTTILEEIRHRALRAARRRKASGQAGRPVGQRFIQARPVSPAGQAVVPVHSPARTKTKQMVTASPELRQLLDMQRRRRAPPVPETPSKPPTQKFRSLYDTPDQNIPPYPLIRRVATERWSLPMQSSPLAARPMQASSPISKRDVRRTPRPAPSSPLARSTPQPAPSSPFPLDPRLQSQATVDLVATMANEHGARYRANLEQNQRLAERRRLEGLGMPDEGEGPHDGKTSAA
ncbi:MAG: hypothetical protein M1832_005000 [Thelocarpon impressellum]|nr:MAG: hypothetical protein M1832_005000 [Thelocarpon impressellum]